jgi:hypothetical protein
MPVFPRTFCSTLLILITGMLECAPCLAQAAAESGRSVDSDEVIFINGDRVSGHVEELTKDSILLLTKTMGEVTVSLYTVKEVRANGRRLVFHPQGAFPASSSTKTDYMTVASGGGIHAVNTDSRQSGRSAEAQNTSVSEQPASGPGSLACNIRILDSHLKLRPSIWALGITTVPGETVILGTQSQQAFGGFMTVDVCENTQLNESEFDITGQHTRSSKIQKPSITTDTLDGRFVQKHEFRDPSGAGMYGIADMFFNNSLGLALQKSFGVGLFTRSFGNPRRFSFRAQTDVRYVNERFYKFSPAVNLAGIRFDVQAHYTKGRFSIGAELEPIPMLNDAHAFQGFGKAGPSYKLNPWFCVGLSEEEHYLGNAPTGFRKNYFASTVNLTVAHDSSPACK